MARPAGAGKSLKVMSSLREELLKSGLPPLPHGQLLSHRRYMDLTILICVRDIML